MFSTDFIFRQQENLVDNQKCQAGFRPQCNKILFLLIDGDFCLFLLFSVLKFSNCDLTFCQHKYCTVLEK